MIKVDAERWRLELLLPWYAAGTLSRSESDCVEKALAGDVELARRYALVLEEFAETINLNEALGEPSASVAETLFAAIGVEEALHRSTPNKTRRYFVPIRLFAAATFHRTTKRLRNNKFPLWENRGATRWRKAPIVTSKPLRLRPRSSQEPTPAQREHGQTARPAFQDN